MSKLRIAFQNNTDPNGLYVTPMWIGLHDGNYDLFDTGATAGDGLEILAEDGVTDILASELAASQASALSGVITSTENGSSPVFEPGELASTIVDADSGTNSYLAFASMIIPSNDAFIGNHDPIRLFDENGAFLGAHNLIIEGEDVYDAGTESNTEFDAPFTPNEVHGDGQTEGGVVRVHEGFKGSVGNPLEPGEEAFILGQQTIVGTLVDPLAADFTQENFQVGTVHVNEVVETDGTSGNDVFVGGTEDDIVNASGGDDLIEGGAGWDVIDGGDGEDTYVIRADFSDYEVAGVREGFNVSNKDDDSDLLTNIEHIQFDDAVLHVFSDGTLSNNTEDVADNYVNLDQNRTEYVGTDNIDGLIVRGNSSEYTFENAESGDGKVLQSNAGGNAFLLNDFEYVVFEDASIELSSDMGQKDETLHTNFPGETQYIVGTDGNDVFVIDDSAANYGWGPTQDGEGIVVWTGKDFNILYDVESIRFNDLEIDLDTPESGDVSDIDGAVQHLAGTEATDTFIIDANSSEYRWDTTLDGEGIVVWNVERDTHDILYDFEDIQFNDVTVSIDVENLA